MILKQLLLTFIILCFSAVGNASELNIELSKEEIIKINSYSLKYKKYKKVQDRLIKNQKIFFDIQNQLEQAGLPKDFIWISVVESGFDSNIQHGIHRGLWQHSPATGKRFNNNKSVNLFDTNESTKITIKYLLKLKEQFNNNHRLMIYAYNYGSPRIEQLVKKYGENFSSKKLPFTTRNYIAKLYASKNVFSEALNVDNQKR